MSKTIFITGASSGIGFETAIAFVKAGHTVYALSRNKKGLSTLKESCKQYKGSLIALTFDLKEFKKEDLNAVIDNIPYIDVLINNAGTLVNKPFLEITESELKQVTDINYFAVLKTIQVLYNKLLKSSAAHIVNIGSVGGVSRTVKFPGLSVYSSSKGALSILSECLAEEFKSINIKVNCLALGAVNTKMLKNAFPEYKANVSPSQIANYIMQFSLQSSSVLNGQTQIISLSTP
jgi:short-subunit dehydrogenase